ncbi:MAG: hypothetical protein ATN36_00010 [Epulopiscium sp. Nele67-Bin005]|nr:MAG: hypothetical protein ATN36_00010 [Epulopiscium sp. Nele67-Bin005]
MTNLLITLFITDADDTLSSSVRKSYGMLASAVSILANILLFLIKFFVGIIFSNIAITADAINNLSDMATSIVGAVGFKLSAEPPDKEHPFGHARIEYISALFVAIFILIIGLNLANSSIEKIITPAPVVFSWSMIIALLFSIAIKLWLSRFNSTLGKKIGSPTLKAIAMDSLNDTISTSIILLGIIFSSYTNIQLDGILGLVVSLFIVKSGLQMVKETVSPLLGEAPNEQLVNSIQQKLCSYDDVIDFHDLIIHNYGPNKYFVSVHIEIDANNDLISSHNIVEKIENDFLNDLDIHLVSHIDPKISA